MERHITLITSRIRLSRVFFGWWTVLTAGFLAFWAEGYFSYGFSALFKPIANELGFNRAVTSVAAGIMRLESAVESPLTGWVIDRFGPKWVVIPGVLLMSLGLILMYFIESLWAFYITWGVIFGTGFVIAVNLPMDTAISNWFVKKRGKALSVRMIFSGLSGVLVMPLIAWIIDIQDWRVACLIGGLVMLLIGLPMSWFFVRQHRPEYYGLLPDGIPVERESMEQGYIIDQGITYTMEVGEAEFSIRQAMKTRAYWLLLTTQGIHIMAASAINVHAIPFLTDMDIDPLQAAAMMAIMVAASIPPRPIIGFLFDRVDKNKMRYLLIAAYIFQCGGVAFLLTGETITAIYFWLVLYGVGMGAGWCVSAPVRARYFGRKAFGRIGGSSMFFLAPIGMVTPIYFGWIYDTYGSYQSGFALITILLAVATVLAFFTIPPGLPDNT